MSAPGPASGSSGLLVIESPQGEPLGGMALIVVNARSRICEISRVMLAPDSRGSGVALSAIRLACRHALCDQGMHRIQAECYGDNPTAHRLFERAGFTREGTRRHAYWRRGGWLDGVLFGLLAEELSPEAPQAG